MEIPKTVESIAAELRKLHRELVLLDEIVRCPELKLTILLSGNLFYKPSSPKNCPPLTGLIVISHTDPTFPFFLAGIKAYQATISDIIFELQEQQRKSDFPK